MIIYKYLFLLKHHLMLQCDYYLYHSIHRALSPANPLFQNISEYSGIQSITSAFQLSWISKLNTIQKLSVFSFSITFFETLSKQPLQREHLHFVNPLKDMFIFLILTSALLCARTRHKTTTEVNPSRTLSSGRGFVTEVMKQFCLTFWFLPCHRGGH